MTDRQQPEALRPVDVLEEYRLFADNYRYDSLVLAMVAEIERLRDELEVSRNQKPAYWGPRCAINGGYTTFVAGMFKVNPTDVPLYLAAGAQPEPIQEPAAWAEMIADAREVFDANGSETPQVARDVIEYVASWGDVFADKSRAAGAQPAPSVPDVDSIVDLMSEFATHDIERGKMEFDKRTLREAVEAAITAAPEAPTVEPETAYGDGFHDGYWKAKSEGMTADEREAVEALLTDYDEILAAYSEEREMDGWGAVEEDESARIVRAMLAEAPEAPSVPNMTAMVDAAMEATQHIHPPITRSQCKLIIESALSAAPEAPKSRSLTDAALYLSNLVSALDTAFISSWQSTHHWQQQLDDARDYLVAHGIKEPS